MSAQERNDMYKALIEFCKMWLKDRMEERPDYNELGGWADWFVYPSDLGLHMKGKRIAVHFEIEEWPKGGSDECQA